MPSSPKTQKNGSPRKNIANEEEKKQIGKSGASTQDSVVLSETPDDEEEKDRTAKLPPLAAKAKSFTELDIQIRVSKAFKAQNMSKDQNMDANQAKVAIVAFCTQELGLKGQDLEALVADIMTVVAQYENKVNQSQLADCFRFAKDEQLVSSLTASE